MFYSDLYSKSSDQRMNFQFDKMLNNYTKQIKNCQISQESQNLSAILNKKLCKYNIWSIECENCEKTMCDDCIKCEKCLEFECVCCDICSSTECHHPNECDDYEQCHDCCKWFH